MYLYVFMEGGTIGDGVRKKKQDTQIRNIKTHEEHTGADMWPAPRFRLAAKKRAFANPSLESKSMFLGS